MNDTEKKVSFGFYHLVYVGSDGKKTERDIDILCFNFSEKKEAFYAYCHLRKTFREFLLRGVEELYSDGQMIPDPKEYLKQLYLNSKNAVDYSEYDQPLSLIKALWWFACGDGIFSRKEISVINQCAKDIIPNFDEKFGRSYISQMKLLKSDVDDFAKKAVDWSAEYINIYCDAVKKLYSLKIDRYSEHLKNFYLYSGVDET